MAICRANVGVAIQLLGRDGARQVYLSAKKIDAIESQWRDKLKKLIEEYNHRVAASLLNTGHLPTDIDFTEFYFEHAIGVMREAVHTATDNRELTKTRQLSSSPPRPKIPRSFRALQEMYDRWRKTGKAPSRIQSLANKVKKQYLQKCQSVWNQHTQDFRAGESFEMRKAVDVIRQAGDKAYSRAKMIVETETTNYYNKTRREIYDQSPEVTHYLFLAIRDQATTKWCKTRNGMVLEKGTEACNHNTPPVHWNCRSEIVPLSPLNPVHKKLIEDASRRPSNRSLEPLPKEWNVR